MGFFDWLFGKKEQAGTAADLKPTAAVDKPQAMPLRPQETEKRAPESPEVENLRRWKESGKARAWVEQRRGQWDHNDWLKLLDELQHSPYWPMRPEAVGLALEQAKREWQGQK